MHGTVYDTSADALAGYSLCRDEPCPEEVETRLPRSGAALRGTARILDADGPWPAARSSPLVWNTLKSDFSSCRLPYSQALDVSRSYLRHFGSCRFEEMRTFRKCITEFVLDPVNEPHGLRRPPVALPGAHRHRARISRHHARGIRTAVRRRAGPALRPAGRPRCAGAAGRGRRGRAVAALRLCRARATATPGSRPSSSSPSFSPVPASPIASSTSCGRPGFVPFRSSDERENGAFPQCEPCCLEALSLQFPDEDRAA